MDTVARTRDCDQLAADHMAAYDAGYAGYIDGKTPPADSAQAVWAGWRAAERAYVDGYLAAADGRPCHSSAPAYCHGYRSRQQEERHRADADAIRSRITGGQPNGR